MKPQPELSIVPSFINSSTRNKLQLSIQHGAIAEPTTDILLFLRNLNTLPKGNRS